MDRLQGAPGVRQGRILGLDLLRIFSMMMVIVLHILGQGGILNAAPIGSAVWYAAWGMECFCYCAVNCYGLLTGYLAGSRRPYAGLALLWLETVLYSLIYALVFRRLFPDRIGSPVFLHAVFPVFFKQYWYFTGYFGLALIMPVLRPALERIDSRSATILVVVLLLIYCSLADAFLLHGGYSLIWLLVLCLMGAMLRRSDFFRGLGVVPLLLAALVCLILTFVTVIHPMTLPVLGTFTLLSYTSPTVAAFAVCLLLLFARIQGREGRQPRLLPALSQASFGVYIIHTNQLLWTQAYLPGTLGSWAALPAGVLLLLVPACAVGVYLLLAAVDILRARLFRLLRLRPLLEHLEEKLFRRAAE